MFAHHSIQIAAVVAYRRVPTAEHDGVDALSTGLHERGARVGRSHFVKDAPGHTVHANSLATYKGFVDVCWQLMIVCHEPVGGNGVALRDSIGRIT